jgi:hypothetical protein
MTDMPRTRTTDQEETPSSASPEGVSRTLVQRAPRMGRSVQEGARAILLARECAALTYGFSTDHLQVPLLATDQLSSRKRLASIGRDEVGNSSDRGRRQKDRL